MKYPLPDLYDRYSIELLKHERANADNEFHIAALLRGLHEEGEFREDFASQLHEINGKIWDLESAIRMGKEHELGLEEVGRRALQIRQLNNVRISIKNDVANYFGEFKENKYDHASQ